MLSLRTPTAEAPSGLPPDEPEDEPLGAPDEPEAEPETGPDAMPGIPTEGDPPDAG